MRSSCSWISDRAGVRLGGVVLGVGVGACVALGAVRPAFAVAARAEPIHRVDHTAAVVALTFDACATRTHGYGFDRGVYDVLRREGVPATIFVSGRWVEFHPAEMAELARDPLIGFGDHSYDHPHMPRLTAARMGGEIEETEAALARYGKKSVAFRPPFGDWNRRLVEVARARGLPTVTWDVVSADPSAKTTTERLIHNVVDHARAGSIIIFHINGRGHHTAEALPEILRALRARGLGFVPLAALLEAVPPSPARPMSSSSASSSPSP
jgi:peptidoglycan/xylan/chitin deacetylase (PgdA/CDA1 family)